VIYKEDNLISMTYFSLLHHSFQYIIVFIGSCNKALESFTLNEHENDIYCKTCYTRNFAPKTAAPVSTG